MRRLSTWLPIAIALLACTPAPTAPPPVPAEEVPGTTPATPGFAKPCRCNPNGSALCDGWVVVRFTATAAGDLVAPEAIQSCGADELRKAAVKSASEMDPEQKRRLAATADAEGHVELLIQFDGRIPGAGD